MWNGKVIELNDWCEFPNILRQKLSELGFCGLVAVRNFEITTFTLDDEFNPVEEVDRLDLVLRTGTDRDASSPFSNALGHDYDHALYPSGKRADEIIYAYLVEVTNNDYLVHFNVGQTPIKMDLLKSLDEQNGILIFRGDMLERVAKNEYWFNGSPVDALLLVFKIKGQSLEIVIARRTTA